MALFSASQNLDLKHRPTWRISLSVSLGVYADRTIKNGGGVVTKRERRTHDANNAHLQPQRHTRI